MLIIVFNLKEITVQADSDSLTAFEQNYAETVYSNEKPVSSGMDEGWKDIFVDFNLFFNMFNILTNFKHFLLVS